MRRAASLVVLVLLAFLPAGAASTGADKERIRVAVMADAQESGERPYMRDAIAAADEAGASLLLYGGDTSHGYGAPPDDWVAALGPFRETTLFVPGNHDDANATAPWRPEGAEAAWWSARVGQLVVVALDTESALHRGSDQRAWLEETLAAHADDTVLVAMHISWWAPNVYHDEAHGFPGDAEEMDALVAQHGVDIVLGAHEHYYARSQREGVPYVLMSAVEAQLREVPDEVRASAEASASVHTWALLDVLPCGLALRVHERGGDLLDAVEVPRTAAGDLRVDEEGARCIAPEPPTPESATPPATPTATPPTGPELSTTSPTPPTDVPGSGAAVAALAALVAARVARRR